MVATRAASIPIIPSSRALSWASETASRLESRAMTPPSDRDDDDVEIIEEQIIIIQHGTPVESGHRQYEDVHHRQFAQPRPHRRFGRGTRVRPGAGGDRRPGREVGRGANRDPPMDVRLEPMRRAASALRGPAPRPIRNPAGRPGTRQERVPFRPLIQLEEASDLGPHRFVAAAGPAEPGLAPGGGEPERGIEQVFDPTPAFRCHPPPPRS